MRTLVIGLLVAVAATACSDTDLDPIATAPAATPVTMTTLPVVTVPTTAATTTSTPAVEAAGSIDDLVLEFVETATGFAQPVLMLTPPDDDRLFVVDQPGVIWVISDSDPEVFLEIVDEVEFDNEQGLLGLAFHPQFAENRLFYIYYIASNGDTVVEEIASLGEIADKDSRTEILRLDQPATNHNGGMLAFGPDGNLWIGLGDGGGANDQFGHGQRSDSLFASMVRITVGPDIDGYLIPDGNLEGEVWATGLRNPWRWTFDGDDLWIADVGQARIEEVDVVDWTAGNPNFGWSIMEGSECFEADTCDSSGLVLPIYEYPHSEGCSITGGFVYRGSAIPELAGQYLFADYCTGWLRSVDRDGQMREWFPADTFTGVTSFGVDGHGELHVVTSGGSIYAVVRAR
ncbi:MAG: PQQ-dependent sugar dehydrogenase [Actinomycetota bacterium]|nr:PQQ-dependent sugar dehydrogenase [Actinomycetota bacterium]